MKDANRLIEQVKKLHPFEKRSQEEHIKVLLYMLFKFVQEHGYRLFCLVTMPPGGESIELSFCFNTDYTMVVCPREDDEDVMKITIPNSSQGDNFYLEFTAMINFLFARIQERHDNFPGSDGFLGEGSNENDFF